MTLSLAACQAGGSSAPAPVVMAQAGDAGGISAEEWQRLRAPGPAGLTARREDGGVRLSWKAPPAPGLSGPLAFDPTVVGYRIFAIGADEQERLVGETKARSFVVTGAQAGEGARFVVRAVQKNGEMSDVSAIVTVR